MLAILHAVALWRPYLLGKLFQIKTNHQILKYFPVPVLVTMCNFLEFLDSSLDTACSRFTCFLGMVLLSTIGQSSKD